MIYIECHHSQRCLKSFKKCFLSYFFKKMKKTLVFNFAVLRSVNRSANCRIRTQSLYILYIRYEQAPPHWPVHHTHRPPHFKRLIWSTHTQADDFQAVFIDKVRNHHEDTRPEERRSVARFGRAGARLKRTECPPGIALREQAEQY